MKSNFNNLPSWRLPTPVLKQGYSAAFTLQLGPSGPTPTAAMPVWNGVEAS
ncbi:MAG: hypothetical protein J4G00_06075 [Actinomycetia bacterium]|nr:hypothetical protein [Actinomycetes bacterium]